jgi:hypothetical protein
MKLLEVEFKCGKEIVFGPIWKESSGDWICKEKFSELWNIPKGIKTIWISLHNSSNSNRHKANISPSGKGLCIDYNCEYYFFRAKDYCEQRLKPFAGQAVYIQVEY